MTPAFILHRWPFQETSMLLELFTRDAGRVRVIAKGARSAKNKWRGALQAFTELDVLYQGRGELATLTQADSLKSYDLQGHFLYSGFYLNELVQRVLPERYVNTHVFDDYRHTLGLLQQKVALEPVLRKFEWQLLQAMDINIDWLNEAECGDPIHASRFYQLQPERGFLLQPNAEAEQPEALVFSGQNILAMTDFQLDTEQRLRYFKWIMRAVLQPHIGSKPLQSRNLFSQN